MSDSYYIILLSNDHFIINIKKNLTIEKLTGVELLTSTTVLVQGTPL